MDTHSQEFAALVGRASTSRAIDAGGGLSSAPTTSATAAPAPAPAGMKRSAAEAFEDGTLSDDSSVGDRPPSKKKLKDDGDGAPSAAGEGGDGEAGAVDGAALADGLEEELQCGCCSAIVYRPVVVAPCQHFFCGRCVFVCSLVVAASGEGKGKRC